MTESLGRWVLVFYVGFTYRWMHPAASSLLYWASECAVQYVVVVVYTGPRAMTMTPSGTGCPVSQIRLHSSLSRPPL